MHPPACTGYNTTVGTNLSENRINLCISLPRISGNIVECQRGPGPRSLNPIVNRRFLPHGLRCNPFPCCVGLFEIVHLVKFRGRGGGFRQGAAWPAAGLSQVLSLKIGQSQLRPIEFSLSRVPRVPLFQLQLTVKLFSCPIPGYSIVEWHHSQSRRFRERRIIDHPCRGSIIPLSSSLYTPILSDSS